MSILHAVPVGIPLLSPLPRAKRKGQMVADRLEAKLKSEPSPCTMGGALRQGVKRMHGLPVNHIEERARLQLDPKPAKKKKKRYITYKRQKTKITTSKNKTQQTA